MIRTFLAIRVDDRILEEVVKFQKRMIGLDADVKWDPREKLHVTVKFFGYVTDEQLETLSTDITAAAGRLPPCIVRIHGTGFFGSPRNPRVLWVGVTPSNDTLRKLSDECDSIAKKLNLKIDKKEFRPHLTIGRFRSPKNSEGVLSFMKRHGDVNFGEYLCGGCVLFKSELKPEGAEYTEILSANFKNA